MTKDRKDKKRYEAPVVVLLGELATAMGANQCTIGTGAQGKCSTGSRANPGGGGCGTGSYGIPCNVGDGGVIQCQTGDGGA